MTDKTVVETCERCGRKHPCWSAMSPLWNAVMRGGAINGEWEGAEMICANCFMELAEERGIASPFYITAERINVPLELVTPSGRVWGDQERRWIDGEQIPSVEG
jgi:hypothetical protein